MLHHTMPGMGIYRDKPTFVVVPFGGPRGEMTHPASRVWKRPALANRMPRRSVEPSRRIESVRARRDAEPTKRQTRTTQVRKLQVFSRRPRDRQSGVFIE